jgi:hypothetical protein
MEFFLKKESRGVVITVYGAITGDDLRSLNSKILADKDFPIWRYKIWDFSNAEKIDLSLSDLRSFTFQDSIASDINSKVKVALILGKHQKRGLDDVFHLLSKQWDGYESKSFLDVKSAKEWVTQEKETDFLTFED